MENKNLIKLVDNLKVIIDEDNLKKTMTLCTVDWNEIKEIMSSGKGNTKADSFNRNTYSVLDVLNLVIEKLSND